jgi:hypothetical protein
METTLCTLLSRGAPMSIQNGKTLRRLVSFLDKYSILVAAVIIYGYYLLTSIELIKRPAVKHTFLDYLFQFDSLIFMWVIAAIIMQLQKYRRQRAEDLEYRKKVESEFERQRVHLRMLDDITKTLHETMNNPLATISISSHTIRRKHESDRELVSWLDRIDTSLKAIHNSIAEMKASQTEKIVQQGVQKGQDTNLVSVN